jgi:hypothetical protein
LSDNQNSTTRLIAFPEAKPDLAILTLHAFEPASGANRAAFRADNAAAPWDISMASAPAALAVWAAEAIPTREPMQIARVTVDLMRPVPVAPGPGH